MNIESINKYLFVLLLLSIASQSFSDQTEFHISNPVFHVDNPTTGEPLSGGKVYFYEAGTTTPKPVYQDASATVSHATPVVLDAYGNKQIYGNGTYKVVITDSDGVTLETMDYVHISTTTTSFAESILGAADAATARTLLGLGTGAITDVGTDALQLVQLDSNKKLPSVNASQLTGFATQQIMVLPRAYLAGFTMSNTVGDTSGSITISAGACRDVLDATNIILTSAISKQIDAAWAVGSGNGGMNVGGSLVASTWYHVFVISCSDTVDAIFSTSASSPSLPTGYSGYRRIGSVRTGEDSGIIAFHQFGDEFTWDTPILDIDPAGVSNIVASASPFTLLYVPTGIDIEAKINAYIHTPGYDYVSVAIYPTTTTMDQNPFAISNWNPSWVINPSEARITTLLAYKGVHDSGFVSVRTGKTATFTARAGYASSYLTVITIGYIDRRGRDD